jgi:hypothetical protein
MRGQSEPQMQGWWSDAAYSLVPSTSVCVEALARPMARFATLFSLGGDVEIDRAATTFNPSMREGRIVWREGDCVHTLLIRLGKAGKVSVHETRRSLGLAALPSGELVSFGDQSGQQLIARLDAGADIDGSPSESAGVEGHVKAGYAFARLYAPHVAPLLSSASFLAQNAAFHSPALKHADHLTFVWHEGRRAILSEAGRYEGDGRRSEPGSELEEQGFLFTDPKRVYAESTRAHNCVELDGKSYPRKGVRRFGSALRYAGEQGGLAVTDCEVTHARTVRHRRVLVMAPGRFLLALDWLNDRTQSHDYRQWFQFAPDWTVERRADGLSARAEAREDAAAQTVRMFNLIEENAVTEPMRGQSEPQMQGWWSDAAYSLVPSTSVCVEALARPMARFATLFALGGDVEIDMKGTRLNATLRSGKVRWADAAGRHLLTVTMAEPGNVAVKLETAGA